jgi:hypothetical protein
MSDKKKFTRSKHNDTSFSVSSEHGQDSQLFFILDQLPVGVIIAEAPSGKVVWGNRQVEKIWSKPFKLCEDFNEFQEYYLAFHLDGTLYDPEERPLARSLLKGEVVSDEEIKIIRGDGTEGTILARSAPIRDKNGNITAAIVIQNDITEQKRLADETLRLSEEKFTKAFYGNTAAMVLSSLQDGRIIDVNEGWLEVFGYTREEVIGRSLTMILWKHPEERAQMVGDLEINGLFRNREYDFIRKNGKVWTALMSAQVITLHGERVIVSSIIDITERKQMEEENQRLLDAVQQEKDRLSALINSITDEVWFVDTEKKFTLLNPSARKEFGIVDSGEGIDAEKFVESLEIYHLDGSRRTLEETPMLRSLRGEVVRSEETMMRNPVSGEWRYRQMSSAPVRDTSGGIIGSVGVVRDITEHKKMEEENRRLLDAVQQEKDRLSAVINSITDEVWFVDTEKKFTLENQSALEEFGIVNSNEGIYVEKLAESLEMYSSDGSPRPLEETPALRALRGEVVRNAESIVRTPLKGELRYRQTSSAPVRDAGGNIIGSVSVVRDITEHKKMEEALRESEERLQLAQSNAGVGVWDWIVRTGEVYFSSELELLYGVTPGTVKTYRDWQQLIHPDDIARVEVERDEAIARGQPFEDEFRILHGSGEIRWIAAKGKALYDEAGEVVRVTGINMDITERKNMEAKIRDYSSHLERLVEERTRELKAAERLAAIGQTAGMVGHDIRNPLQSIEGALYLAREGLNSIPSQFVEKSGVEDMLNLIGEQSKYINKIVSDLQDYARPLKPQFEEIEVGRLIEDALCLVSIPQDVDFSVTVEKDIPKLMMDPVMMKRVLTNLITNAVQAMPDGGKLTINVSKKEEAVYISVQDTGEGIPETVRPRLFTPLVTTKAKGQGFGLAVCKRLVEVHGGEITFESEVGKGSTFIVNIPVEKERIS